jgi:serine carboxypeptidase-like clade II
VAGFPEYSSNDFWISGESYAGIYVPTLAYDVVQYNAAAPPAQKLNLKGIMVGNGCLGNAVGVCGDGIYGE